jgi:hypothetical protein
VWGVSEYAFLVGHIGQHGSESQIPTYQALVADHAQNAVVVGAAAQAAAQCTAVGADLVGLDHQRVAAHALGQRWQFAVCHHFGQSGRFFAGLGPGVAACTQPSQRCGAGKTLENLATARVAWG